MRKQVVQVKCDRCKRVELVPPSKEDKPPDFTLYLKGHVIKFDDICVRCKETLDRILVYIQEWDRDGKPLVGEPEPDKAAPIQLEPHYTKGPNPHSERSAKANKIKVAPPVKAAPPNPINGQTG